MEEGKVNPKEGTKTLQTTLIPVQHKLHQISFPYIFLCKNYEI